MNFTDLICCGKKIENLDDCIEISQKFFIPLLQKPWLTLINMKKFLFILNQQEGQFSIPLDDILFLKADSRYTKIITREKTYLSCKTLKLYHEELEEAHFFYRLDRSHLISINNLSIILDNKLYFNDKDISCSYIKIRELRKYLNNKQMSE